MKIYKTVQDYRVQYQRIKHEYNVMNSTECSHAIHDYFLNHHITILPQNM